MQELRLVAVSEDGSYAVLTAPGSGGRFSLRIDDRLRVVARGRAYPAEVGVIAPSQTDPLTSPQIRAPAPLLPCSLACYPRP